MIIRCRVRAVVLLGLAVLLILRPVHGGPQAVCELIVSDNSNNSDNENVIPALSAEDRGYLENFEKKFQLIRDRVAAVVNGTATGFFLYGPGGVSKSYTVIQQLDRMRADYVLYNSRGTGKGLFNILKEHPDSIVVLEDMERLFNDAGAQGVLRSALWGQQGRDGSGRRERLVTWTNYKETLSFVFTGGIIVTSNRALDNWPELAAIKTRVAVMHLQPTQYEVRALMRKVAASGYVHEGFPVEPAACAEVCEFVLAECRGIDRPLDVRLLVNAIGDYLQDVVFHAGCSWRDLVAARIRERPTHFRDEVVIGGREERLRREQQVAAAIYAEVKSREDRMKLWYERTGKSQSAFYRRLGELGLSRDGSE